MLPSWLTVRRLTFLSVLAAAVALPAGFAAAYQDEAEQEPVKKDVPYVPTPEEVVDKMLELAQPKKGEVLYDLGCGDGRIVVTAAKKYGVKGIGVDIDPERIKESNENAKQAGVTDQVKFIKQDLFTMDFKDADVMTLYLLTSVNERLRPKILEQLRPGARLVSHAFSMGDWEPDQEVTVEPGQQTVYFWIIPAKVEGSQTVKIDGREVKLDLKQEFQKVTGTATIGGKQAEITDGRLRGRELTFTANGKKHTVMIGGDDASIAEGDAAAEGSDSARTAGGKEKGNSRGPRQQEQQQDQQEQESGQESGDSAGQGQQE